MSQYPIDERQEFIRIPREQIGWIRDAAHIIEAYIGYSKEMARKYGRGYAPSGLAGHTDVDVAQALNQLIARYDKPINLLGEPHEA